MTCSGGGLLKICSFRLGANSNWGLFGRGAFLRIYGILFKEARCILNWPIRVSSLNFYAAMYFCISLSN